MPALDVTPPPAWAVLLTVPEAALILRASRSFVYERIADGSLATRRIGRKRLVHRDDLAAYLAAARSVADPGAAGPSAPIPPPRRRAATLRDLGWSGDLH